MKATVLAAAAAALLAAPATAAASLEPPMALPGDASAASLSADPHTWIVGARPSREARTLAARYGARLISPKGTGGYLLARSKARAFAAALRARHLLQYAQANTYGHSLQAPSDPLSATPYDWRAMVADPTLTAPPVTPTSPLIALVDAQLDPTHPEFAGGNTSTLSQSFPITIAHGTATASVAAAPQNGVGIVGIWPGARAVNVPLPPDIPCSSSARQIRAAIEAGASVINMSYGSEGFCYPEYVAIQDAVAHGIVPVAAAGNEFNEGNPVEFPASLPHVLTIASVGADRQTSYFSNANGAIDLSAPGENIETAVPPALDEDGNHDGWMAQSGTSFAAPIVAGAVAWVRAARPSLTPDQVAQAVRLSAADLDAPGWDVNTGFGLLSVAHALSIKAPPRDPAEPNDDIRWVDGREFGKAAPLFYKGKGHKRLSGLLDAFEDPADVYRIRLRGHSERTITANPTGTDDVALYVYRRKAKRLSQKPYVKSSHKKRGATERITLRNTGTREKTYYVALRVQPGASDLDAGYALRVG
jgi:subtilisin family serine protease